MYSNKKADCTNIYKIRIRIIKRNRIGYADLLYNFLMLLLTIVETEI